MVDQVREQPATYLLDKTRMSVEAVAEALGFAETASFSRAFKRWKECRLPTSGDEAHSTHVGFIAWMLVASRRR
ncbi:transcriptional regulator GlxA family with amidase domain [Bradyrhizobium sp. USDA 3315]